MTRGFMGLLSESEDHLDDAEGRIRGERVALSGFGKPAPLVEAHGAVVAFGDPQLEPLQLAKARPVDDRTQECRPRPPSPAFRFHPHAAHVAGRRMLSIEEPEDKAVGAPVLLGEEHDLAAGHGHRLREADPVRIGLPSLVDEAAREGVGRLGEGAEPQLPEEFPFASLKLADPHAGSTTWSPGARAEATATRTAAPRDRRDAPLPRKNGAGARGALYRRHLGCKRRRAEPRKGRAPRTTGDGRLRRIDQNSTPFVRPLASMRPR